MGAAGDPRASNTQKMIEHGTFHAHIHPPPKKQRKNTAQRHTDEHTQCIIHKHAERDSGKKGPKREEKKRLEQQQQASATALTCASESATEARGDRGGDRGGERTRMTNLLPFSCASALESSCGGQLYSTALLAPPLAPPPPGPDTARVRVRACVHARTRARVRTYMTINTHTRTHERMRARAHTHTHTHTQRERERERERDLHTHKCKTHLFDTQLILGNLVFELPAARGLYFALTSLFRLHYFFQPPLFLCLPLLHLRQTDRHT